MDTYVVAAQPGGACLLPLDNLLVLPGDFTIELLVKFRFDMAGAPDSPTIVAWSADDLRKQAAGKPLETYAITFSHPQAEQATVFIVATRMAPDGTHTNAVTAIAAPQATLRGWNRIIIIRRSGVVSCSVNGIGPTDQGPAADDFRHSDRPLLAPPSLMNGGDTRWIDKGGYPPTVLIYGARFWDVALTAPTDPSLPMSVPLGVAPVFDLRCQDESHVIDVGTGRRNLALSGKANIEQLGATDVPNVAWDVSLSGAGNMTTPTIASPRVTDDMERLVRLARGEIVPPAFPLSAPAVVVNFAHGLRFGRDAAAPRLPVRVKQVGATGVWNADGNGPFTSDFSVHAAVGNTVVICSALTGALVCAYLVQPEADGTSSQVLTTRALLPPNRIGRFPKTLSSATIPLDTQRILVSLGRLPNGNVVTREQHWKRTADSFSMAGASKRTVGVWKKTGTESTSTSEETLSTSVDASASAGWGPVSATLSASLSDTSTTFHQVTIKDEVTTFESIVYANDDQMPQALHFWQLTDVVTVYDGSTLKPIAVASSGQAPVMVDAVRNPS